MPAQLLEGKTLAAKIKQSVAEAIIERQVAGFDAPGLAVILVGNDVASEIYVQNKQQACKDVGIKSSFYALPDSTTEHELTALIKQLNNDSSVNGILLQLPLPSHLKAEKIIEYIDPEKDVDGFHPYNVGRLVERRPTFRPCTPLGIMTLLDTLRIVYPQKKAVVVGASTIVGKPMFLELLAVGCTVTICHRLTPNLEEEVGKADLLVSAVGKANLIPGEWIKENAIVVDVGINRLPDGTLTGDVDFKGALQRAAWITPVPGGVGPMTVAALLLNTLRATKIQL